MQITGQILNVTARTKDGYPETFTTPNGQFYVFEMAIQQPQGPLIGQINSKSPQYPASAGEQITVISTSDNHGIKFKKVNPQYDNQQQQQDQGQQQPQQGYQQQQQQRPPQDNIQDRIAFAQAYNLANADYLGDKIDETRIKERTQVHYNVLKTRQFPFTMSLSGPQQDAPPQQPAQQQAPQQQQKPAPEFDPDKNPTDDIPF